MKKRKDKLTRVDVEFDEWLKRLAAKRYIMRRDKKQVPKARITKAIFRSRDRIEKEIENALFED